MLPRPEPRESLKERGYTWYTTACFHHNAGSVVSISCCTICFHFRSHRRKMIAVTFLQTTDKNIFKSTSFLLIINNDSAFITATQSLQRTACPTTVRRRIKKRTAIRRGKEDFRLQLVACSIIQLCSYSINHAPMVFPTVRATRRADRFVMRDYDWLFETISETRRIRSSNRPRMRS